MDNMKITITFILSTLLFSFISEPIPSYPNNNQALLWKVKHPNNPSSSYIFGTMHLIEKEYFFYPKQLKRLIQKAPTLILELEKTPESKDILKHTQLKEGNFFDFFNTEQTDSILEWAKNKLNMERQVFRSVFYHTKPFVLSQLAMQSLFIGKTESYEQKIYQYAKEKNKQIIGLETIDFQLSLMDELPQKDQAKMVMDIINKEQQIKNDLKKLQKLYKAQKIDSLYIELKEEISPNSNFEDLFITNRNNNWIPILETAFQKSSCFVAVGAGHVGGPKGLLRLLEKKGYELTPIYLNNK